ncbi:MAG TPA: phosphoribosylanthranilate isomerase [Pirellulales bacterium]|jgi:phosphoribosylanthranilate isomerase|nr:phosphoribosylanthranilate isomerase [Pirellulales bacterium]
MFQIKICGITSAADGLCVADAGADAVGLNFCPASPRHIELGRAEEIVAALPGGIARVGVFVNAPAAQVDQIARRLRLDYVQLHGDEPPEYMAELAGLPVIRAFRGTSDFQHVAAYLAACRTLGHAPVAVLIDAFQSGQYGGTGQSPDWSAVARARLAWAEMPLVLAGGLKPANVAAAIQQVGPAAVDTASGVERSPGRKAADLVDQFVAAARGAFDLKANAKR